MPDVIDVTGLPEPVVNDLRQLVNTLRGRLGASTDRSESPAEWAARLTAWVASHPKRAIEFDDSRESIYGGRGE